MKKILLTTIAGLFTIFSFGQTTATDFTANDCAGNSHNLFTELDAGKVIVISFIMPCTSCIGPSQTAYSCVQGFASSNPGRVSFYIADDDAGTPCSTINSWATANSMPNATKFSNTAFVMAQYGTSGMPKIVVLGGASHTIFYNQNNTVSASAINTAITNALNASTGIAETKNLTAFNVFPNPTNNITSLSYSLKSSSDVNISIYNIVGQNIKSVLSENQVAGEHKMDVDCSKLNNGLYFVKIVSGEMKKTIILSVVR